MVQSGFPRLSLPEGIYLIKMELSIIIPAFNERKKIGRDIETASSFLKNNHLKGEIIVVDDGSTDNTDEVAKAVRVPKEVELDVVRYDEHKGKGFAVRAGIRRSMGKNVMFVDSGNCVPYKYVLNGLNLLKNATCDIAHGSRKLAESNILVPQTWFRRVTSTIFRWFMMLIFRIPSEYKDTQCGFKIYKGDLARRLYNDCVSDGFLFDIEIILRALKQGLLIKEFPIEWTTDRDSRLSQTLILRCMFAEIRNIKRSVKSNR